MEVRSESLITQIESDGSLFLGTKRGSYFHFFIFIKIQVAKYKCRLWSKFYTLFD